MRVIASLNLCYLFFLVSSVFSATHIDHAFSHEIECGPNNTDAHCHSDLPHEHEDAHPGEDSLLEHAFEDGASLIKAYALIVADSCRAAEVFVTPEIIHSYPTPEKALRLCASDGHNLQSSRAPPR